MIMSLIGVIFGLGLVMLLPGYLLSLLIFREIDAAERIFIAIGLSMSIAVGLGFFLSLLGYALGIKAISPAGTIISFSLVCLALLAIYLLNQGGFRARAPESKRPAASRPAMRDTMRNNMAFRRRAEP